MQQHKIYWADNLRVLATFSVIVLHVSALAFYQYGKVSDLFWWTANIYDGAVRYCVPIFMMLTGALLFRKDYELGDFLKNKFLRIILPFLFWSMVYIFHDFTDMILNGQVPFGEKVKTIFNQLKTGSSYHLWYIYMVIGVYLFIPIISKWIRNATAKEMEYFLMIWILVMLLNQPYIMALDIKPVIDFTYFTGFIGYLVLGYYLSIKQFKSKVFSNSIAALLILIGMAITIYGTYYLTFTDGISSEVFYGFLTPNVLIFSTGIFFLFKNHNQTHPLIVPIISFVSQYSYGIYLVHVLVLTYLGRMGISCYTIHPIVGIPLTSILCLMVSGIIVFLLNKIPFVKYIAG